MSRSFFVVLCSRPWMMDNAAHFAAGRRGGAMTGMGSSGGGPVGGGAWSGEW